MILQVLGVEPTEGYDPPVTYVDPYVDDLRLIPLGRTVYPDDAKLWPHLGRGP